MNLIPKICMVMISLSLGIFFSAFYYYQGLLGGESELASKVSEVTSVFTSGPTYDEPALVAGNTGITEERVIILLFFLAGLLSFLAILTALVARIKVGAYQSYVPILLCAVCIIGCIAYTGYWYSLDGYI